MAFLKCKMCGGNLEIAEGMTVCECEYCGSTQTVPTADNEKKLILFGRANRLRFACEFDKAAGIYEAIVAEFPEEAEAYWGLVLCKYGIEYVDDPATGKKVPTCHRSSFDSVMDDVDFEQAMENADGMARRVYREEAKVIEELRKGIIEVSGKEEPYDIFICYKETDENGDRTIDSVIAQDVYDALTEKGYRVFFSRITLEDKLGKEYEPYIFAALNSAKVMLAFGTDYEYYNAVWVKNEWSRYLKLMSQDKGKYLIPCYKGIDAYDMPKEFAKLQSQDMGKVGAIQDLVRGIDKILGKNVNIGVTSRKEKIKNADDKVSNYLNLIYLALEDEDFDKAEEYIDKALNINSKCAPIYVARLMVEYELTKEEELKELRIDIDNEPDWKKAIRFADAQQKKYYTEIANIIRDNFKEDQRAADDEKEIIYQQAEQLLLEEKIYEAATTFGEITDYKDAKRRSVKLWEKLDISIKDRFDSTALGEAMIITDEGKILDTYNVEQEKMSSWEYAIQVVGYFHTALLADGTVVSTNDSLQEYLQKNKSEWRNIKRIFNIDYVLVGIDDAGKLHFDGSSHRFKDERVRCLFQEISTWSNIKDIQSDSYGVIGITGDGKIKLAGSISERKTVLEWTDVKQVRVVVRNSTYVVIALKNDGTVVADYNVRELDANDKEHLQRILKIKNITKFVDGYGMPWVMDRDGTVYRGYSSLDVNVVKMISDGSILRLDGTITSKDRVLNGRENIVEFCNLDDNILLIDKDGKVHLKHAFSNEKRYSGIQSWKIFENVNTVQQKREEYIKKAIEHREEMTLQYKKRLVELEKEKTDLTNRLPSLNGLLKVLEKNKTQTRLKQVEKELIEIREELGSDE